MVSEGSGLYSGWIGTVISNSRYSQQWIADNEPGRYKPFDPKTEVLLRTSEGKVFTMFKTRLQIYAPPEMRKEDT